MKDKIVYIITFLLLFVIVSAGLVFMNGKFNNIFKFDFSPIQLPKPLEAVKTEPEPGVIADTTKKDSTATRIDSLKMMADSISLVKSNPQKKDETKGDEKKADNKVLAAEKAKTTASKPDQANANIATQTAVQTNTPVNSLAQEKIQKAKKDSIYTSWLKQTVKLYESMDSKKAAKVIQGYSDNIARDILLKMKKKKAAEILAELKPDVVTRIISVN